MQSLLFFTLSLSNSFLVSIHSRVDDDGCYLFTEAAQRLRRKLCSCNGIIKKRRRRRCKIISHLLTSSMEDSCPSVGICGCRFEIKIATVVVVAVASSQPLAVSTHKQFALFCRRWNTQTGCVTSFRLNNGVQYSTVNSRDPGREYIESLYVRGVISQHRPGQVLIVISSTWWSAPRKSLLGNR